MSSPEDNFINIYHNSPNVISLYKVLIHDLDTDFLLISWYVVESYWFIPLIYDKKIDGKVLTYDESKYYDSQYLTAKPDINNIPKRHTVLKNPCVYQTDTFVIIYDDKNKQDSALVVNSTANSTANSSTNSTANSSTNSTANSSTNSITNTPEQSITEDSQCIISTVYHFILNAFIEKLMHADILKRTSYRYNTMLTSISTNIQTPLNNILNTTSYLMKGIPTPESLEYLNYSSISLVNNICDIIDLNQLEDNMFKVNKDIFNLHEMIAAVISITTLHHTDKQLDILYHIDLNVPIFIYSDIKRLKQILINLLDNAYKYTMKGEIALHVSSIFLSDYSDKKSKYKIQISIADTGLGMSNEISELIFTPIEIRKKQIGVSLRVSYLLARLLDGHLDLIYTSPKGSCFQLDLLCYEEEQTTADSNTLKLLKGKKVLMLDATQDRILICKILLQYDIHYTIASTYEEMLMLYNGRSYDLIIINMNTTLTYGDMKQTHILQAICKKWKPCPILGICMSDKETDTCFNDVIIKPIDELVFKQKLVNLIK